MDLTLPIDQINADKLTTEYFRNNYLKKSKPLIINNYSSIFPAGKTWDFEYLKKRVGNFKVGIFDNRIKTATAYVKPHLYMPFAEYLDIIKQDKETPYRIFLFNLFKEFPELRKELPTPVIMKGVLGKIGFAFFGGKNSTVRFHYDIDASNVLLIQLIGQKRVILISPEYNRMLYKLPFSSFSLIEPDKPDMSRFPALKYVKGYDFTLYPGDALFMPSRFWHFNTYLEGGMAVSYRSMANSVADLYQGLMNTTLRLALDKTMNKFFKDQWVEVKQEIAMSNAKSEINKAEIQSLDYKIKWPAKQQIEVKNY